MWAFNISSYFCLQNYSLLLTLERVMGIEPTLSAWKAEVLPLNYTRVRYNSGRDDTIRTCDPLVPNQVLYQAELRPVKKWCRREDLNPQPTDYKSVALPVELQRHIDDVHP